MATQEAFFIAAIAGGVISLAALAFLHILPKCIHRKASLCFGKAVSRAHSPGRVLLCLAYTGLRAQDSSRKPCKPDILSDG